MIRLSLFQVNNRNFTCRSFIVKPPPFQGGQGEVHKFISNFYPEKVDLKAVLTISACSPVQEFVSSIWDGVRTKISAQI